MVVWPCEFGKVVLLIAAVTQSSIGQLTYPHGCSRKDSVVDCRHSNLTSLPSNLPQPESIEKLFLSGNKIKSISFELRAYPALRFLDVSSNNITRIKNQAFDGVKKLELLILRRNFLVQLTNETFLGLKSLTSLDLGYNMLTMLPDSCFQDLGKLTRLDLMKNNISTIKPRAFDGLHSLTVLNLTHNLLQQFPRLALTKLTTLTRLVLDDNKLKQIPKLAFSEITNLQFLSLNGNNLSHIDPSAFAMTSPSVSSPLKELTLKGTDLYEVPKDAFSLLTNLENLDISKNKFRTFVRGSFSELFHLRKLSVTSSKHLKSIENGTFSFMFHLEELVIKNNKELDYIGVTAFPAAETLKLLDLTSNLVRTFHQNMVDWDLNVSVDLRYNKLHCDCNLLWMLTTLTNATNANTRLYALNLTCASPAMYTGRTVLSLSAADFRCRPLPVTFGHDAMKRVKTAAIAAGVTSVVLIITALLLKFRKQICMVVRRQYRYRHYKNNGVIRSNGHNGTLHEEGTPMEVIRSYEDDSDTRI